VKSCDGVKATAAAKTLIEPLCTVTSHCLYRSGSEDFAGHR
jgi:hypothetical protein